MRYLKNSNFYLIFALLLYYVTYRLRDSISTAFEIVLLVFVGILLIASIVLSIVNRRKNNSKN